MADALLLLICKIPLTDGLLVTCFFASSLPVGEKKKELI